MMIGVVGGVSVIELGSTEDVGLFFRNLFSVVEDRNSEDFYLADRLFRRYIDSSKLLKTESFLRLCVQSAKGDFFRRCCESIVLALENSCLYVKRFKEENPVRIICTDPVYWMVEKDIPLEDYDNLEGDPLWMRPEYMLEKYG